WFGSRLGAVAKGERGGYCGFEDKKESRSMSSSIWSSVSAMKVKERTNFLRRRTSEDWRMVSLPSCLEKSARTSLVAPMESSEGSALDLKPWELVSSVSGPR